MHPFCFSIVLLLLPSFASPQNASPLYTPRELILLNCGATRNESYDGRNWESDSGSKFVSHDHTDNNSSSSYTLSGTDSSVSQVPYYHTVRIIHSNFTYSFPVSVGPKFLRLYFYPETYSDRDKAASFFSVVANGYTLLSNFSAFLALPRTPNPQFSLSKEFVVWAGEDQQLKVTFIPNPNSYAFVNAIEVVSMPTDLYYGRNYKNFSLHEANNQFSLTNTTSLETLYRLNVGGSVVLPRDDTGMFRTWDDDFDLFEVNPQYGANIFNSKGGVRIDYNEETPKLMAPEMVYMTSRIMGGHEPKKNLLYNLSWSFPVDCEFSYLVRLYFCENQPEIQLQNQRVFNIYIDNQIAKEGLDVINMAGNVAGFNPNPPSPKDAPAPPFLPPHQNRIAIFAGVSGGVLGLVLLSVFCFLIFRRRTNNYSGSNEKTTLWDPFSTSGTKSTKSRGSSLPSDLCRHFSLTEIKEATNNFDQVFIIGTGGFGNVYKGLIDDGSTPVAIKRLNPGSRQGAHEFLTEIEMLSRLRHLHLVSLIGFCEDDNEMILVYDYMSRGTLRDHLYNTVNPPLTWTQRLEICIGAARGLHYLHTGAKHTIIHRDVKTTNILLDEKWVAKVSDFGLSRVGSTSVSKAYVTTVVKGSFGYLDPEYYKRQHLTEKSDVYSFGVVLCEVICAKPALNRTVDKKRAMLAEWARDSYRRGTFEEMVDVNLKGKIAAESLKKYGEIAMNCLAENGNERPSMSDVVWGLEFVLQLQKTAEERMEMKGDEEKMVVEINHDTSDIGSFSATTEETSSSMVWTSGSGEKPLMGNY